MESFVRICRYNVEQLLVFTAILSCLFYAVGRPSKISILAIVVVGSIVGATYGRFRFDRSVGGGALGGAVAVVAFVACYWPVFLSGYFSHQGDNDYFEDGFFVEAFIYPVVYCAVYGPVGAAIGAMIGFALRRGI